MSWDSPDQHYAYLEGQDAFSGDKTMVDMDGGLKMSLQYTEAQQMPSGLVAELALMRRNPAEFSLVGKTACYLACDKTKGARSAFTISCAGGLAGAWCSVHGWLWFDSTALPPTEQLTRAEIADNRAALARKRGKRV